MSILSRRFLAAIMSLTLLASLLPLGAVKQAFAFNYFSITSFSTDKNNPTTVNAPTVDIKGIFSTQVVGSSITYEIQQIADDKPAQTAKSTQTPTISSQTFTFKNVQLFSGLNKIIIKGKNTSGNDIQTQDSPAESAYVYFANVPIVYDVKLTNGTRFDSTVYVDESTTNSKTISFTFNAPNATETSINGIVGVPGGGNMWIASGIPLEYGTNEIKIVAKNSSQSYTATRQAVLFNQKASFNLETDPAAGTSKNQSLKDQTAKQPSERVYPTLGETSSNAGNPLGSLKGKIIVTKSIYPDPTKVGLSLDLIDVQTGSSIGTDTTPALVTASPEIVNGGVHEVYTFTSTSLSGLQSGKKYEIKASLTYNGSTVQTNIFAFTYRGTTDLYIIDSNQLYGANFNGSTFDYSSKTQAASSFDLFQAPLTLGFTLGNATAPTITVEQKQDGSTAWTDITADVTTAKSTDNTMHVVQIAGTKLLTGLQTIRIRFTEGTETDEKEFTVNYVPAPTIHLTNVYNGQVFTTTTALSEIKARFANFNGAETSTKVYVNETEITAPWTNTSPDNYKIELKVSGTPISLQPGANTILVHGDANGIPIEINLTVFVFSQDLPQIGKPIPKTSAFDSTVNNVTVRDTGDNKYYTTDKDGYFRIPYSGMDNVKILINGADLFGGEKDAATLTNTYYYGGTTKTTATHWFEVNAAPKWVDLKLALASPGTTSVTVIGTKAGVPANMTFEVIREVLPYEIKSPELPKERIINQNFWMVKIRAENADSVIINKETAARIPDPNDPTEQHLFGVEVRNLKPGKNTIKFTVTRAGTPINGSIDLYYANQNTIGAQYKTPLGGNTISAFNKSIEIKLPKNTLFRNVRNISGIDNSPPYLFDQQQVRFGMASKNDGTVEKVSGITTAGKNLLINNPKIYNYMFASPLYWVDAGYYDESSSIYKPVDGLDPYSSGTEFYAGRKWLQPTNRGEIVLQYDPALRDAIGNTLSVWRFYNNEWQNLGGVVNTSKHTITAEFDGFGYYTVMMLRRGYNDVQGHPWARDFLETMMSKGIMLPKNNSDFGVYDLITRGEFAQIMVKAIDAPLDYDPNNLTFYDVPNVEISGQLYDYKHIETAYRKGIVRGIGPSTFNPTGSLTRQDAAIMIARAVNAKVGSDQEAAQKALSKVFTDSTVIDYYAAPSVLAVNKLGIMKGSPNVLLQGQKKQTFSFNPLAPLTRAEASSIAYKMMQNLKKLPK
ncbi:S-layer homology domain-containing protein [Effusibacillus consociatus]|uniref:S-layer homology domain-containing protein n=1 Tax=Effusibacillus consociatus TaxID=1117041 RepID=A0ABV9Q648_9BACL